MASAHQFINSPGCSFEKMLYDQGQLVVALHDAYVITKNPVYMDIITDVLKYVQRDMTAPGGAFYSAEDADSLPSLDASHKSEGAFYIWSKDGAHSYSQFHTALTVSDIIDATIM
jgi:uncharacterized protein YyaL (SSP411 family)